MQGIEQLRHKNLVYKGKKWVLMDKELYTIGFVVKKKKKCGRSREKKQWKIDNKLIKIITNES